MGPVKFKFVVPVPTTVPVSATVLVPVTVPVPATVPVKLYFLAPAPPTGTEAGPAHL
jgi:hypothetical protein